MTKPQTLRLTTLAAGLLLASSTFAADGSLSSLVYGGGEAMSPETEARMTAQLSVPGAISRDDVRQQLLAARQAGTLVDAGEIADTAPVLQARVDYAARQTREILAGYEAERVRLAAIEAERARVAALEAEQARQAAVTAAAATTTAQDPAAPAQPMAAEPAVDTTTTQPLEAPADRQPSDAPAERPGDTPAMSTIEVPITRPSDLPAETIIDKE